MERTNASDTLKEKGMIAVSGKYQACFFADMKAIQPSADTIPPLLEAFRGPGLLPNTFHELGLGEVASSPEVRLRLSSPTNEWVIDFDSNRISIEKNAVKPGGVNLGPVEAFTRDATEFLRRILAQFPRKGNRLSLVTSGLADEMPEETLCEVYSRVMLPLDFYETNAPAGWDSRSVTRICVDLDGRSEKLNVITRVGRIQGNFTQEDGIAPFDRIQIEFDINTYQGNSDPRFEMPAVQAFYPRALEIRRQIIAMLEERING